MRLRLEADQRVGRPRHPGRPVDMRSNVATIGMSGPDDLAQRREEVALRVVLLGRDRRSVERQHDPRQPLAVLDDRLDDQRLACR